MHKHPVDGVEGSKPRLPGAGNGSAATKAQLAALSHSYLEHRNRAMASKAEASEITLLEKKGLLVARKTVALQCAFLLSAFRQGLLSKPAAIAHETAERCNLEPAAEYELARALDGRFRELLHELARLPGKLASPNWTNEIDADLLEQVTGASEPRTPREAEIAASRAERRLERRNAAQRRRRAL